MNYIVAAMLIHADEETTFWILVNIFERFNFRKVYKNGLSGLGDSIA